MSLNQQSTGSAPQHPPQPDVPVKAYTHDGIRRFRVSAAPPNRGLNELKRGVRAITADEAPVLKWQDDDGDFITIAAPPDFAEAVNCIGNGSTLKVFVNGFTPTTAEMSSSAQDTDDATIRQSSNTWGSSEVFQNIFKAMEDGAITLSEGVKQIEKNVSTQMDTMMKTQQVVSQETLQGVTKKMEEGAASLNAGLKQVEKTVSENFDSMVKTHGLQDLDKKITKIIEEKLAKVSEYGHWNEASESEAKPETDSESEVMSTFESKVAAEADTAEHLNEEIQRTEPENHAPHVKFENQLGDSELHFTDHPHHTPQLYHQTHQPNPVTHQPNPVHHAPQYPHHHEKKNKKYLNEVAESFARGAIAQGQPSPFTDYSTSRKNPYLNEVADSLAHEYPSSSVETYPRRGEPEPEPEPNGRNASFSSPLEFPSEYEVIERIPEPAVPSTSSAVASATSVDINTDVPKATGVQQTLPLVKGFQTKIDKLKQMGFQQDDTTLAQMLSANNGSLHAVVESLL